MATDKLTGAKLPNGDVSTFINKFNTELINLTEKGITVGLSLEDKAHFLGVARQLKDAISLWTEEWSKEVAADETFSKDFEDLGITIATQPGATNTAIDSAVAEELTYAEIKQSAKFTEKALKEIGKENLIEKYKKVVGTKAAFVTYKEIKK